MIGFGRKKGKEKEKEKEKEKPSMSTMDEKQKLPVDSLVAPPSHKKLPALFDGLAEKQINQLYAAASIIKLDAGEILFKKGAVADDFYILLDGRLEVEDGNQLLSPVDSGAVAGLPAFLDRSAHGESARASEPSTVMVLSRTAITMLKDDIKALIYEKILRNDEKKIYELEKRGRMDAVMISSLERHLFAARTQRILNYNESDLILNIVKKIPKLPAYTHTLTTRLLDVNVSSKEVVDVIRQDPALVADVLKSVNSSYYGLEQKVSDMNSAVLLLGFQALYQLIISEGIRRTMPDTDDFRQIHARALALSYITFSLSMTAKLGVPVQMSTIGLLHNIGESVVSLLKQRNPNLLVFIDALDRPSLGAFLLEGWNFPSLISKTVKYQDFPEFAEPSQIPEDVRMPVALLYLSQLCYKYLSGITEQNLPLLYYEDYLKILKLKNTSLGDLVERLIVGDLKKKRDTLPLSLKELIK